MASSIYFYRRQGCFAYSLLKQITTELDYKLDDETLTLLSLSDRFTLEIETEINPSANTELQASICPAAAFLPSARRKAFARLPIRMPAVVTYVAFPWHVNRYAI
jgi:hypothetical protein